MALRLADSVTRIEVDNRERGCVMGQVWLRDAKTPARLRLEGNCLSDLAGARYRFELRTSRPRKPAVTLEPDQTGIVGDMTASRKVKVLSTADQTVRDERDAGEQPKLMLANCLYLEWFSNANGRVVIETVDFTFKVLTDPCWTMTREENTEQERENTRSIRAYAQQFSASEAPWDDDDDQPMNEFEWEAMLRESDARTERLGDALDRYADHPDADSLVAREMGWDWLEDALDAEKRAAFDGEPDEEVFETERVPNPLSEGRDWIRTKSGLVAHPLAHRAYEAADAFRRRCMELGVLEEEVDDNLHDLCFQARMLSAKLAGALNDLAYDDDPEPGFVVAYLKRALKIGHAAIGAAHRVQAEGVLPAATIEAMLAEQFAIRESLIALMEEFRSRLE